MKKPALLRAAIAAALPELARDPQNLLMWVEIGSVRARAGGQRGFAWTYQLNVVADEYAGDPAVLFFVVTEWLRAQAPDLLAPGAETFTFEADILDQDSFSIQIRLTLEELVRASAVAGGWQLEHVTEPPTLFPEEEPLRAGGGPVTSIWVAPGTEAPFQVAPGPAA